MTAWTDPLLDAARRRADPDADALLAELFATSQIESANALFAHLRAVGGDPGPEAPPLLRDWLHENAQFPVEYDPALAEAGQKLFERIGVAAVMALFNRALPQTYSIPSIATVLAQTQRLTRDGARRVNETARLVLDVGAPGGFGRTGHGVRACQQVRLVHAAVRIHVRRTGTWNPAFGAPINQEDQALTLQGFSGSTVAALQQMGYDFTAEEEAAYLHVWQIAGHFLGVEPALRPGRLVDSLALVEAISRRHEADTPEGRALTAALTVTQQELLPGTIADGVVPVMMRWLNGDRRADLLGVSRSLVPSAFTTPFGWINRFLDDRGDESKLAATLLQVFNHTLMNGVHDWYEKGQPAPLRIPTRLVLDGGLPT